LNLINCRPPENDLASPEGQEALEACRLGFEQELTELYRLGVRTLVPLGAKPTAALGIDGSIHKVRGSVYDVHVAGLQFWAIPTFHPSFIIRGEWAEEPTVINDIEKASNIALNGYTPPEERFELFPTVRDVELRCRDYVKKRKLIAVDTETTALAYYEAEVFVMAFAESGEDALSIPFYSQGFKPYWHNGDLIRVKNAVADVLEKCPTMYQNANFDISVLEHNGFYVGNPAHDTILMQHAYHPELPKNLGYIVSVHGMTQYWKDIKLSFPIMCQTPDKVLRTYNCRDSVVLHQVKPSLLNELEETGTSHIYYDYSLKLIRPTLELTYNGMKLDKGRLAKWKKELENELSEIESKLYALANLPPEFSFQSPHHLSYLFYGELPGSLGKWKAELESYDEADSRKKKNTKKYSELSTKVDLYFKIKPLAKSKSKTKRNKTGFAKDAQALLLVRLAANTELELISKYRSASAIAAHKERIVDLKKLIEVLKIFEKRQATAKMLSTYTSFPTDIDGHVHPSYYVYGTSTGRLSSAEPNFQNIPSEAKRVFVPEKGNAFVQGDFSNLEVRVMAYEFGDEVLEKMFLEGKNIHDENTKVMFGITPDHPHWKHIRRAAKVFVFGRSYGGGVRGIYERVCADVPEVNLTMEQFRKADNKYFDAHPALRDGFAKAAATARDTRCCTTATGRKRFFLGTFDEIEREGINTPIQGAAGDIANESLIDVYAECQKHENWKMAATVHDSIVIECPISEINLCAKALKSIMEKPRHLWNRDVVFPADIEVSTTSWADMESYEEWKRKAKRSRKPKA
ncbi:MAG: DNA polymerase, partial [Candidatus Omnitrophota bacterium]